MFEILRSPFKDGDTDSQLFIAKSRNGDVIGSALVTPQDNEILHLDSIQTRLGERKTGIGSALINAVIALARALGKKHIEGDFHPEPTANEEEVKRFYYKHGFKIDGDDNLHLDL